MGKLTLSSACLGLLVACVISSTCAHNITSILEKEPRFSQFNQMLTETGMAKEINQRHTITVLALSNDNIGSLNGKSTDMLNLILRTHVVLDYYDLMKLTALKMGSSTRLTTMYQESGAASWDQGFLNLTKTKDGIKFGSMVKGAPIESRLVATVAALPYNISVLSISQPIETPGFGGVEITPISAPPPPKVEAPAPEEEIEVIADAPEEVSAPAPAPSTDAPAPVADAPEADSPAESDDLTADDAKKSSAGNVAVSAMKMAVVVVSCIALL